jgi:hypothetical protein
MMRAAFFDPTPMSLENELAKCHRDAIVPASCSAKYIRTNVVFMVLPARPENR